MSEMIRSEGDALSKLIQLQSSKYEVKLPWTGRGVDDLRTLLNAHAIKSRLSKHLWGCLHDLVRMPEMETLPEAIRVHIVSAVLNAQALTDLDTDAHAARMAAGKAATKG